MFKYIVKRLLISIIILLGVSVIIYTLVRLMPSDYVDNKFSSQLQQGSITQDEIDNFKSMYGLYNPEAELILSVDGIGDETLAFTRDVKKHAHTNATQTDASYYKFAIGKYRSGEYTLTLSDNGGVGAYKIIRTTYEEADADSENDYKQVTVDIDEGTFTTKVELDADENIVSEQVILTSSDSSVTLNVTTTYKVASFGKRLGSILGGYFTWLGNLAKGDLGNSFKYQKPVAQVISENMWISFAIALVATVLQFAISIPLGISSATHQYSAQDYIVTIFTMIGLSLPTYFFAALMIKLFAVNLGWLPTSGLVDAIDYPATFAGFISKLGSIARHLILPIAVSVILSLGGLMRYTRTNTLEVLNADYIRTARAKGLSEKTVVYKHAFRNTLIPLATLLAGILPSLFGGMMITEQVFAIDGIGNLAYNALREGDVPFVMGYNMFLAILTVIGTLLSDVMYAIVDPRVKLGK